MVNVGRQPIALLDWWIDYGGEERQGIFIPDAGTQATGRPVTTLEPGHLVQLAIPHQMLRSWKPDASHPAARSRPASTTTVDVVDTS